MASVYRLAATPNTLKKHNLGQSDYVWNWDFKSTYRSQTRVDWAMRFIFHNNAEVDHVKDRLDGVFGDPGIIPVLPVKFGSRKYANIYDGGHYSGDRWDGDSGIKDQPACTWNSGHMRFYAKGDQHYNSTYGYYLVASNHQDYEGVFCQNKFRSTETTEDFWVNRIKDHLGSRTQYDWDVSDSATIWRNGVAGYVDIGGGNHKYQSNGLGPEVDVSGN